MPAPKDAQKAAAEVGGDEVQAKFDEAAERGFFGDAVDDTPREEFTLRAQGEKLRNK